MPVAEATVADLIDRARAAYARLAELGECVEDEWSYVSDLAGAGSARLDAVAAARGAEPSGAGPAVDRAIEEIALIEDPHRAIDWLSTFPQVVLLALGEEP
jgi:hypothetical protein